MWQDSGSRYGEAAFLYMTHSTVVITCKSARHIARKEKSCAESDPPQNRGVMRPRIEVHCGIPLSGPMGVALVLIYPCGKAWNSPPFPSRFIVSDRAVGREGELAHDKGYYHSCLGRSRKGTFRPYQPLEPQPRGAVTRGAVARRRSRASGLTRLSAQAIRGFGLGFVGGPLAPFRCGMI